MRSRVLAVVSLALAWCGVFSLQGQTGQVPAGSIFRPSDQTAQLKGVVLDGRNGKPIEGASVGTKITDREGRFSVEIGVLPLCSSSVNSECHLEQARLVVLKSGYAQGRPEEYRIPGHVGIPLAVEPKQTIDNLIIRLFPVAVVSGKVFDSKGRPLPLVSVTPFRYAFNGAGMRVRHKFPSVTTNDLGEFRFSSKDGLDPGEYFFEFQPSVGAAAFDSQGTALAPTYYPGTLNLNNPESVAVEGGLETRLNGVILPVTPGASVRVRALNEVGETPLGSTAVTIYRNGELLKSLSIPKDRSEVAIGFLSSGDYEARLRFFTSPPGDNEGRVSFRVDATDLEVSVPVRRIAPRTVTGRAIIESGILPVASPAPGVTLGFYDFSDIDPMGPPRMVKSQSDGVFPVTRINSRILGQTASAFRLRVVDTPPHTAVVSIKEGERNALKDGVVAEPGKEINLRVVLTDRPGTIRGTMTGSDNSPVSHGVAALVSGDSEDAYVVSATTADRLGVFKFEAAPGNYRMIAWAELLGAPYYDFAFLKSYIGRGLRVALGPNEEVAVTISVQR